MKAVNLIPQDLRRGSSAAGRTGSSVYVLLGVLGMLVVLATAWGLAGRQVTDRKNDLVRVQAEALNAETRAGALAPYAQFATLRDKRVETVTSLSRSRFNWPYALREISRVLPANVWLTGLTGTVAPGVSVEAGGGAGGLRSALAVPAVELSGCTVDMENVARYLARLRSIDGVTRVSLASSEKAEGGAAGLAAPAPAPAASSDPSGGDCRQGSDQAPKFEAVVFFERSTATPSSASGAPGAPAAAPAAGTSTTPSSGSTATPSSSSSTPTSGTGSSTGSAK